MGQQPQIYRLIWQGIEIEARYWSSVSGVTAHLERATLPITGTGYRSHFTRLALSKAAGDVAAQVIAWLDEAAASREWRADVESSRQPRLF